MGRDIDVDNLFPPGEQRSDHNLRDDELWLSNKKWLHDIRGATEMPGLA
jgi:hypothetical protein